MNVVGERGVASLLSLLEVDASLQSAPTPTTFLRITPLLQFEATRRTTKKIINECQKLQAHHSRNVAACLTCLLSWRLSVSLGICSIEMTSEEGETERTKTYNTNGDLSSQAEDRSDRIGCKQSRPNWYAGWHSVEGTKVA